MTADLKSKIINELKVKHIEPGFSISDIPDLKLDNKVYQACSASAGQVSVLYLLSPITKIQGQPDFETLVRRICRNFKYRFGYFVIYNNADPKNVILTVSKEISV